MSGESLKPHRVSSPAIRILILSTHLLDREVGAITQRLRAIPDTARIEIIHESAARIEDFQAALLRHQPTIVHFSRRGAPAPPSSIDGAERSMAMSTRDDRRGGIPIGDEHGESTPITAAALADLLRRVGGVRCVVLDACFTAERVEILRRQIDCVIGLTSSITLPAVTAFAWTFYQALGAGNSVGTAFELGCSQIAVESARQGLPRLIARDGVNPSRVWLSSSASRAQNNAPTRSRSETLTDCGVIRVQQRDNGRTVIMTPRGSLDEESSPTLCEYVDLILASECQEITLDLGEVDRLDSSGLVVIVKIFKGMRNSNRVARFINARDQPLAFMRRLGINRIFNL